MYSGHDKVLTDTKLPAVNIFGKVTSGLIDDTVLRLGANTPLTDPDANPKNNELPTVNA